MCDELRQMDEAYLRRAVHTAELCQSSLTLVYAQVTQSIHICKKGKKKNSILLEFQIIKKKLLIFTVYKTFGVSFAVHTRQPSNTLGTGFSSSILLIADFYIVIFEQLQLKIRYKRNGLIPFVRCFYQTEGAIMHHVMVQLGCFCQQEFPKAATV